MRGCLGLDTGHLTHFPVMQSLPPPRGPSRAPRTGVLDRAASTAPTLCLKIWALVLQANMSLLSLCICRMGDGQRVEAGSEASHGRTLGGGVVGQGCKSKTFLGGFPSWARITFLLPQALSPFPPVRIHSFREYLPSSHRESELRTVGPLGAHPHGARWEEGVCASGVHGGCLKWGLRPRG